MDSLTKGNRKHPFTLNIADKDKHTTTEQFDIQVILSPCENTDTLFNNNIDTVYQTIIDSIFIKQIDTLTINKTDTISQIQIDSIYIEKTDTIKILIDENGKKIKKKKEKQQIFLIINQHLIGTTQQNKLFFNRQM